MIPAFNGVTGWFDPGILLAVLAGARARRIGAGRVRSRRVLPTFTHGARAIHDNSSFAWMRRMLSPGEPTTMFGAATERAALAGHRHRVASSRNS